jgi:hypothetical protein
MSKIEAPMPEFLVGQTIASDLFIGTIVSAFFDGTEWCYNVGDNADTESKGDPQDGYHFGPKYIKESNIRWLQHSFGATWRASHGK